MATATSLLKQLSPFGDNANSTVAECANKALLLNVQIKLLHMLNKCNPVTYHLMNLKSFLLI